MRLRARFTINSLRSYFKANIELRTHAKARELFKEDWPIHTRTNDSAPSQYMPEAKIRGCSIANGCHIEGNVENCVIGRNVIIKRGAVVKKQRHPAGSLHRRRREAGSCHRR